jgi:hypothetical protein
MIKIAVEKSDDFNREYLKNSLKYMLERYEKGENPKEIRVMMNLPNEAFWSRHL